MPIPHKGKTPNRARRSTTVVLVRWLAGLTVVIALVAGLLSFWIYQAVTLAASQAFASMLAGLSVMASLITTFWATLLLFSAMTLLETPLVYLPFAPIVPYVNTGLRLWAAG